MTDNCFKKFDHVYQREPLIDLLQTLIKEKKFIKKHPWIHADHDIVLQNRDILPMNRVLERDLTVDDFGLSVMIDSTGFHTNPRNNGLIIFPLTDNLKFNFEDTVQITIDSPTLVNGRIDHKYFPINDVAMFYAIKIPLDISWNEICSIVDNDKQ